MSKLLVGTPLKAAPRGKPAAGRVLPPAASPPEESPRRPCSLWGDRRGGKSAFPLSDSPGRPVGRCSEPLQVRTGLAQRASGGPRWRTSPGSFRHGVVRSQWLPPEVSATALIVGPLASLPQRPALAWECPEAPPAPPPLGSRTRLRRGVVTRYERSPARPGPSSLFKSARNGSQARYGTVDRVALKPLSRQKAYPTGGRTPSGDSPSRPGCPRPLSYTLRQAFAPQPAKPRSRARFIFPQNSFVWVLLKIDSRPYSAETEPYHVQVCRRLGHRNSARRRPTGAAHLRAPSAPQQASNKGALQGVQGRPRKIRPTL